MLEIRNITKVYRSKTGEQVVALNNVSITFPETGMVFILGKSGSGKSTLLNVIGGLDSVDSGEFVIMGKSSKDFAGSDFDAYRNTFIGFIFQEYNILDDFNVGANIGLALELQGKKATDEKITEILTQVELTQYARRKPNELSGGQKQRIAIARALVKEPQIIMADEPTGALDSNTGKQVFDTLKKLSETKLVLIVSHDRDFAERYADRIIELADGNIISDVTKHEVAGAQLSDGIRRVSNHILQIKGGYRLTEADVAMINDYLSHSKAGVILSGDSRVNGEVRSAAGLTESGDTQIFEKTDPAKDVTVKNYDGTKTKFIRSRLPMKNAVKMGSSGLKYKKFRLFMTILFSLVAFGMFGLADTMAAYDKINNAVKSIQDSGISNASVSLGVKQTTYWTYDGKTEENSYYNNAAMNDADIAGLRSATGIAFVPVFNGSSGAYGGGISLSGLMKDYKNDAMAYNANLSGFVSMDAASVSAAGMTVTGRLPANENEIAITKFVFDQFYRYGFRNTEDLHNETVAAKQLKEDNSANGILGKHITFSTGSIYKDDRTNFDYTIVGIIDTHFEADRYKNFLPNDEPAAENNDTNLTDMLLQIELQDTLAYGFHTLGFVTDAAITAMSKNFSKTGGDYQQIGEYTNMLNVRIVTDQTDSKDEGRFINRVAGSEDIAKLNVTWLDGVARTALGEKEYLVSRETYQSITNPWVQTNITLRTLDEKLVDLFGEYWTTPPVSFCAQYQERVRAAARYKYAAEHYVGNEATLEANGIGNVGSYYDYLAYNPDPLGADIDALTEAALAQFYAAVAEMYGLPTDADARALEALSDRYVSYANIEDTARERSNFDIAYDIAAYYAVQEIYTTDLWQNEALAAATRRNRGITESAWESKSDEDKKYELCEFYQQYLGSRDGTQNVYGATSFDRIAHESIAVLEALAGRKLVSDPVIRAYISEWGENGYERKTERALYEDWQIVGYFDDTNGYLSDIVVNDTLLALVHQVAEEYSYSTSRTVTAEHEAGIWAFAIAPMPKDHAAIEKLVSMSYDESGDLQFSLQNQVMNTLQMFNSFIEGGAKVFLWIGVGFAVFSALLLMNFIAIFISYKKHEIGILRAVGARSSDVFKIFFSEAFIIAFINYVLAIIATLTAIFFINRWMRGYGINVTLLTFGIRQLALMLLISVGTAALASFLPVWRIAHKKPIDAIHNR